ncbi:Aldo/keto reductase [Terfezia boudieri ATCC MYA-4762]|uniref:Aldo/keto reductase n=1 Tax=Terfezia boudieri ATCC MYA-4762 TaxID=1051890 RepID=A0A3N4LRA0_9PEZI|nr:Aldo/keto reductase [Terfezia boudieri ATCC MYA-4762]
MKAAYDAGVNFFDCAESYAGGKSEIVMGQAIKRFGWNRCDVVISTKIYWGADANSAPGRGQNSVGLSRKHIVEGMNASLKRMDLEYVDLIYAHRPDKLTPMEEVVRAFNHLIDTGKAFYWGTSEWGAEEISDAWRVADKLGLIGPLMEQPQYNIIWRERVEKEYAPLYPKYGTGLTTYSALKGGFLTGKYDNEVIPENTRLHSASKHSYISTVVEKFEKKDPEIIRNIVVSRAIKPIADKLGVTQGQLALAWVIKNPNISSVLTGASRVEQVHDNMQALKVVPLLTQEVMDEIDAAAGNKPVMDPKRFG